MLQGRNAKRGIDERLVGRVEGEVGRVDGLHAVLAALVLFPLHLFGARAVFASKAHKYKTFNGANKRERLKPGLALDDARFILCR